MGSSDPAGPGTDRDGATNMDGVISEHESALLRYATRLLNNADAAQDVVQEAFLRLHRHWGRVLHDGHLRAWLYRTTHNAAIDHIRSENRRQRLHEAQAADPAVGPEVVTGNEPGLEDQKQLALQHLHRLPPAERQVLILRLQEGLSYSEISQVTGRSQGNVGCLLHHATKNLSKSLREAGVI